MTPPATAAAGRFLLADALPERRHRFSAVELFLFSAATWNPHRIHYDRRYLLETAGHDDLLVQGPLQAARMVGALRDALAPGVRLVRLRYRHESPLHDGEEAVIGGALADAGDERATVELWVARAADGRRTTTGSAVLEAPGRRP